MTCTRAINDLLASGLITQNVAGTNKWIMRAYGKPEFLKKGYARLKSPVERILYVKTPVPIEGQVVSGIQALARQSMIGVNERDGAIAVSKKTATRIPADDISLLLSMENDPNERVQMCLDEIRERHELPVKEEE